MNKTEKIGQARTNFQVGNYKGAILLYEELISNDNISFTEKIRFTEKIKIANKFLVEVSTNNIGESFFPAVNQTQNFGSVYSITLTKENLNREISSKFNKSWEDVKSRVANFLQELIDLNKVRITVFDWKFDNLFPSIKRLPSSSQKIEKGIDGSSYQLAMAVALISKLINKKVDDKFAFSGTLVNNENSVEIGKVEGIEVKSKVLKRERENVTEFIHSSNTTNLNEVLERVFGNSYLENIISHYVRKSSDYIELLEKKDCIAKIKDNEFEVTILKFYHNQIPSKKLKMLNEFFEKIDLKFNKRNGILDGLKPNFATGMIILKLNNIVKGFVAVANPQITPDNKEFNNAAVIVYKSKNNENDVDIGDIVNFKYFLEKT